MKRIVLLQLTIMSCLAATAQMAKWIIRPGYDKIYMAEGAQIILSDSAGTCAMWDTYGRRMATTADAVNAFRNGLAVTTDKKTGCATGFYGTDGKFTKLKEGYAPAYSFPYFSDGYLLLEGEGRHCMVDTEGQEVNFGAFEGIYPFHKGYASCLTYEQVEKMKNPYHFYVTSDKHLVQLSYNDKNIDAEDVKFLSSLSAGSIGIAVIKHKVFYFDGTNKTLKPVFATADETNVKKQIQVSGNTDEWLTENGDTIIVCAKKGKEVLATFKFDKLCRPLSAVFPTREVQFAREKHEEEAYSSDFKPEKGADGKFGLTYKGTTSLPPQFEETGLCVGNLAAVRTKGKRGLLTIDDELKYSFKMNKGNDIGFRHRLFETMIRLDVPAEISSNLCRFDVDPQYGCEIDKTSIVTKNTESGNFVQYNCVLSIPDSLPDRMTDVTYPVQITYDGIKYPTYPLTVKAWHYKYINVDLSESEIVVSKGNVEFNINIEVDKKPGDGDYPFEVDVKAGDLRSELEKQSETRYKCRVFSLAEGTNTLYINIRERGLMPSVFPLEITYKKPVAKGEQVEIKKKVESQEETDGGEASDTTPTAAPATPAEPPTAALETPAATTETAAEPAEAAPDNTTTATPETAQPATEAPQQ